MSTDLGISQAVPALRPFESEEAIEARRLLKEKKWPEAVIVLRSILKKESAPLSVTLELANALVYSGRREESLSVLGQALSLHRASSEEEVLRARMRVISRLFLTNSVAQIYQEGLNLIHLGKYRQARERFDQAVELEPDNAEVLLRIGQCFLLEHDPDSASEVLRVARRLNPYEPEMMLWLGDALLERGESKQALAELRMAKKGLPHSERAVIWYANALVSVGQRASAIQVLERDLQDQVFHLHALLLLGKLKYAKVGNNASALWSVRKDMQLLLSRLDQLEGHANLLLFESEMGIELSQSYQEIKTDAEKLLNLVDDKIKNGGEKNSTAVFYYLYLGDQRSVAS